jgi:aminoglycoside N3'-acetyltransferase
MKIVRNILNYTQRLKARLDYVDIRNALQRFGEIQSDALLVHSSLSACGQISGGAHTVIRALRDWVGGRTLAMPTHTYCYPKDGQTFPFYIDSTPSVVGAISECFRKLPDVIRSCHPSHSVACAGPLSEELCDNNEMCKTPCGAGTPYARLVARDCAVLLFGAKFDSYTLFHTAEHDAGVPYLYYTDPVQFIVDDGSREPRSVMMKRQDMNVCRSFEAMQVWFENQHFLDRTYLGRGELLFIPHAAVVHGALVAQLRKDPFFLVNQQGRTYYHSRVKVASLPIRTPS